MENLEKLTAEQLKTYYCNAVTTGAECIGHGKTSYNEIYASHYANELSMRGIEIPDRAEARQIGVFNGPGAF